MVGSGASVGTETPPLCSTRNGAGPAARSGSGGGRGTGGMGRSHWYGCASPLTASADARAAALMRDSSWRRRKGPPAFEGHAH